MKKHLKNMYYDFFAFPTYKLKYKIRYGTWDFFNAVGIETTTYCNLRCKWCPNSKYPRGLLENKKLMETKLFKKIIDELGRIRFNGWLYLHMYGEPLTDKRMPELIAYARKKLPRARICMSSNGILLTLELYNKLLTSGLDYLVVNQYTSNILPNMKKLFEYLKVHKIKNIINYRIFNENLNLCNVGGEVEVKKLVDRPICNYPNYVVNINYKGDLIICCNDYHGNIIFGNLKKESIVDIWNKPEYKKVRDELRRGEYNLPLCKKCVGLN